MSTEITHKRDPVTGRMRQIVSPERLRAILDADGEDYSPPAGFGRGDEWDVAGSVDVDTECACPHCDATTADPETEEGWGESDDGQWYCPDCLVYSTTEDGEIICASHGRDGEGTAGESCPDCAEPVEWDRPIFVGSDGMPDQNRGACGCVGREWLREDRGGWTVPRYVDAE